MELLMYRRRQATTGNASSFAGKVIRGFLWDALNRNIIAKQLLTDSLEFLSIGRNKVSYNIQF